MIAESRKQKRSMRILAAFMVMPLAALLLLPSIPQDQSHHDFAGQRTLLGIPNFWDVVSSPLRRAREMPR